jgi:hypothetical protein
MTASSLHECVERRKAEIATRTGARFGFQSISKGTGAIAPLYGHNSRSDVARDVAGTRMNASLAALHGIRQIVKIARVVSRNRAYRTVKRVSRTVTKAAGGGDSDDGGSSDGSSGSSDSHGYSSLRFPLHKQQFNGSPFPAVGGSLVMSKVGGCVAC